MDRTVGDLARLLKTYVPKEIPQDYSIKSMFKAVADENEIKEGVEAFRDFLMTVYDALIKDDTVNDIIQKGKKKYSDEATITVEYPFVNQIKSIFMNVGEHGILSEDHTSFLIPSWEKFSLKRSYNKNSTSKVSNAQMIKTMRFLSSCGVLFDGIDLTEKKPNIESVSTLQVSIENNPKAIIGWYVMSMAQDKFCTRQNDDILLRCNYRSLSDDHFDIEQQLKEFVQPMSETVQKFIKRHHQLNQGLGLTCHVEWSSLCTHFVYLHKKHPVMRFTTSLYNGHRMVVKAKNTSRYIHTLDAFPVPLLSKIQNGYGCDRKAGTGHGNCQKGCEGFKFDLDDNLIGIDSEVERWISEEVNSYNRRKKKI